MLPVCLWLLIPLCCSPSQGDGDVDDDHDDDVDDDDDDDVDDDADGEMHYCKLG